jgi:hypothetical protein
MSMVDWIHGTSYATAIRESQVIYPLLQCVHIIGIGMFVGGVVLVNLRLAGLGRDIALVDFSRHAMRVAWIGLAMILVAGIHMGGSFIDVFAVSTVMRLKLLLVILAIGNAVIIQRGIAGTNASWLVTPPNAAQARNWATIGIAVLLTIITLGKLLAYIGGKD